jgi:outer membrane protein OmpA-like peptidoglycan-associated protein
VPRRARRRAAILGALLLIAGCAAPQPVAVAPPPAAPAPPEPRNAVVLLPDADGGVGRVVVANAAGERTLVRPNQATRILDGRTAPTEPATMSAAEIEATFGPALAAAPTPPLHFILYFEQGSAEPTAASREQLPAIVAAIRERASVDTSVVGHADTVGDAKTNLALSLRRAMAVGALLAEAGIDPGSLEITSHGKENPLVPTGDNVAEPRNRRVEVTVR